MTTTHISAAAHQWIDGFDTGAHQAIGLWRESADRLGAAARERWDTAFRQSSPELSAETRRNAAHARKVFAGYYNKGIALSTGGAEVAVDTLVQAARTAVERAAGWQQQSRA
jgi:hypothetical protein